MEDKDKGWLITLHSQLDPDIDQQKLMKMEDWEITIQAEHIYFKNYYDLSEPWEDETVEELVNAAIVEVELKLKKFQEE